MNEAEISQRIVRIQKLMKEPKRDEGTILSIFHDLFQHTHEGRDLSPDTAEWLKRTACLFLSPELLRILVKHRLDVYGFMFVALYLNDVDDVIDDLSNNGEILKGIRSFPLGAINKLKRELLNKPLEQNSKNQQKLDTGGYASETKELGRNYHHLPESQMEQCRLVEDKVNQPASSLTFKVLKERTHINVTIEGLTLKIHQQLTKMEELRNPMKYIKNYLDRVNANKRMVIRYPFDYNVPISRGDRVAISDGKFTTNCPKCSRTCHFPYALSNDADKRDCAAMDNDGFCTSCPRKCKWDENTNQPYHWVFKDVTETRTHKDIQKKYEEALQKKLSTEGVFQALQAELDQIKIDLKSDINTITACLQRLDQIALRPDAFTSTDYVELMIQAEMKEKKSGFQERIESLTSLLDNARVVKKIRAGESISPESKVRHKNESTP